MEAASSFFVSFTRSPKRRHIFVSSLKGRKKHTRPASSMTSLNLDFSVLDRPVRKEADELTSTCVCFARVVCFLSRAPRSSPLARFFVSLSLSLLLRAISTGKSRALCGLDDARGRRRRRRLARRRLFSTTSRFSFRCERRETDDRSSDHDSKSSLLLSL